MNKKKFIIPIVIILAAAVAAFVFFGLAGGWGKNDVSPEKGNSGNITLDDLAGKKIAVLTGSIFDKSVKDCIPGHGEIMYANTQADCGVMLDTDKVSAYVTDKPTAEMLIKKYPDHMILDTHEEYDYGFIFPKESKLCQEFNDFLAKCREDGTLDRLSEIWFGDDEDLKTVNLDGLSGEKGTLNFAISSEIGIPFAYVKDNSCVGLDVDLAVRFCRDRGYNINISDSTFAGMLLNVAGGKCDFGASSITITEERKESMLFSDPYYSSGSVAVVKRSMASAKETVEECVDSLKDKTIAVVTGTVLEGIASEVFPESRVARCDTTTDLALMLDSGKISAYLMDEPVARILTGKYKNQSVAATVSEYDYGFVFNKDDVEGTRLCKEMNNFLSEIKADGTLDEIDEIWFGDDKDRQVVDFDGLTGENGTLNLAVSSVVGVPFVYKQDGRYAGYDIDIAVRFCREYGYDISIKDGDFASMLSSVSQGKSDFGASAITITEERKESVLFSDPSYSSGCVVVKKTLTEEEQKEREALKTLDGEKIAVLTGTLCDQFAAEYLPESEVLYTNSNADLPMMVDNNKAAAYMTDEPIARVLLHEYPNQSVIGSILTYDYGYIFKKDDKKSAKICGELNNYLAKIRRDGTLEEIDKIWFGTDESVQVVDYEGLTGENGTLNMAVASDVGVPFVYLKDEKYVGYDVDIAVRFCREYGYDIKILDSNFAGMQANVTSGKCDFGAAAVTINEERKESMLFSDPNYSGGCVVVGINPEDKGGGAFLSSIRSSFEKTFIREDRWQLFLSGICITMLITLLATLFGTVLGFCVYMLCRRGKPVPNAITNLIVGFLDKTPVVVVLMILYYVIFGNTDVSAVVVSIIAFSMLLAANVYTLIKVGVGAIDKGHLEASLALGYTDRQSFFKNILPQAAEHIIPGYTGALVSLIKDTAIVGYIAVQDLTKISDIIRSRTYDAFFPIISSAVIYLALACLLTFVVKFIYKKVQKHRHDETRILKGVKLK